MPDEKSLLEKLPKDILESHLVLFFDEKALHSLALTCKWGFLYAQPKLKEKKKHFEKIITEVMAKNFDTAITILSKHPQLILEKTNLIIDKEERHFKNLNLFRYALWSLDFPLYELLAMCLSLEEVKKQITEHESQGVTYELRGKNTVISKEKHWDCGFKETFKEYHQYGGGLFRNRVRDDFYWGRTISVTTLRLRKQERYRKFKEEIDLLASFSNKKRKR